MAACKENSHRRPVRPGLLDRCDGLEISHAHIVERNCREVRLQDTQLLEFLVRAPLHQ